MKNLIGYKVGMTRIFINDGISIPVTVIKVEDNRIIQIKNSSKIGYAKIQVTIGNKKANKLKKSEIGHFKKNKALAGLKLWELYFNKVYLTNINQDLKIDLFKNEEKVDITGYSKGKGFSGTVKRWGFSMQDASHGNSLSHRAPGSIGQNQTPGRVFKGKKMAGHLGNHKVTVKNLSIVSVDTENNVLLIKGSVPGAIGKYLSIRTTKTGKKNKL